MKIDLKIIDDRIGTEFPIPQYAKEGDAAVDLRAMIDEPITLRAGQQVMVPTGIAIGINDPTVAAIILPRSGSGNTGLVLGNTVGLVDSGYTGELMLSVWNRHTPNFKVCRRTLRISKNHRATKNDIIINIGDRIAQLVFKPVIIGEFNIVKELGITERADSGFGSSGINELAGKVVEEEFILDDSTITRGEKLEDLVKGEADE